ncbi:MAG: RNA methyltransferase [Bacteroidia bacterium]
MLSKNKLKQYHQLASKKFRQKYGLFVVEGLKSVRELVNSQWTVETILCTSEDLLYDFHNEEVSIHLIESSEFLKLSSLSNPQGILAIVKMENWKVEDQKWTIALDQINDPGNLGTIVRIADWYGIKQIVCSKDTVDIYNPKCIQASMGSFSRTQVIYCDLNDYLKDRPVYAAVLDGDNIRQIASKKEGVILIGNEAHGINKDLLASLNYIAVTIPGSGQAESLNAAIATAICCERLMN